jgi:hypothetical protein
MREIKILSLEADGPTRLLVRIASQPEDDFQYVYRAANGVRWNATKCVLEADANSPSDYGMALCRAIEAMRGEYGFELKCDDETATAGIQLV